MPSSDALAAAKSAALEALSTLTPDQHPTPKQKRRARRKRQRPVAAPVPSENGTAPTEASDYVPDSIADVADSSAPVPVDLAEIKHIVHRFQTRGLQPEDDQQLHPHPHPHPPPAVQKPPEQPPAASDEPAAKSAPDPKQSAETAISRKQRKEETRNLISRLKSLSDAPSVVEPWDITAPDPLLLVHLKSWPNSVPVPANWRQKRKYLQNKRGLEKRAFQLPAYISETGVGEMRDAQIVADDKKTLKQRQREKMRAKTGRGVEIDHTRLHDAFFKFQTKPRLTPQGDLYYELRELEVDNSKFKPGLMSEQLRAALGISAKDPPPWLVQMQRYGPPPGYPGLKVAGLNCPIPTYGRYGFAKGEWGKPPVDETGRPLYGDVFGEGLAYDGRDERFNISEEQKLHLWGETVKDVDLVASAEIDEPEEEQAEQQESEKGVESVVPPVAVVTPQEGIELRKGIASGKLYTVLEERKTSVGRALMGSSHVYDMAKETAGEDTGVGTGGEKRREDVEDRPGAKRRKEFKF